MMIDLQGILSGQFVFALGWTFIHSLWQFALIGLVLYIALCVVKKPSVRYGLALAAQLLCFLASAVTFAKYYSSISQANAYVAEHGGEITIQYSHELVGKIIQIANQHLDILIVLWIAGVLVQTIRLAVDIVQCRHLKNHYVTTLNSQWQARVERLAEQLKLKKNIEVKLSEIVSSPCVIGAVRPVILMPISMLSAMPTQYVEAALLHELAHIKRHDYLVNIIISFINNLFFFNPVVHLISKTLSHEREKACDEIAVEHCESRKVYAECLGKMAELNIAGGTIMALNKKNHLILDRIKTIFGDSNRKQFFIFRTFALLILTFIGVTVNASSQDLAIDNINYELVDEESVTVAQISVSDIQKRSFEFEETGKKALDVSTGSETKGLAAPKLQLAALAQETKKAPAVSKNKAAVDFTQKKQEKPVKVAKKEAPAKPTKVALATKKAPVKEQENDKIEPYGEEVGKLPVADFASLPDVSHVSLSPNGKKIVSLIRVDADGTRGSAVQVANIETGEKKIVLFNDNSKYFIYWLAWKDDRTLIAGYFYPDKRSEWLGVGTSKFDSRETRMLIIDTKKDEVRSPYKKSFLKKFQVIPTHLDSVVDLLRDDPDHILVQLPTTYSVWTESYTGVFKLNIKNQKIRQVHKSADNVWGWTTDRQHKVRAGRFHRIRDGQQKVRVQRPSDKKWLEIWPSKQFEKEHVAVMGFGADPKDLYIRAYQDDLLAVFKVDLNDKDLKRELVYSDKKYDVDGSLLHSPITDEVIGLSYSQTNGGRETGGYIFFDPEMKALQKQVDKALPKTRNRIFSLSDDMQKYLVFSSSDVDSGTYFVGDRKKGSLGVLAYRYKKLTPELMTIKQRYDYDARDGLGIEAYLTIPRGKKAEKLPTIIYPHGGPIYRTRDGFDYWTQYFANRGYAVLQPNFRGSAGQGLKFRNAGFKNWGKEMQDDIEDGVKKLIEDGIADPDNICIVGGSYGGYAALMGVVKTPDLYKCSISVNGVANVYDLVKDNRLFWSSYNVADEMIGNDNKTLREISPVNHVDKIKAPVLLIHGQHDRQVDIKHSEEMYKKMKKAGKEVEFVELPNEDHFLTNGDNRIKAFKLMDKFLAKNLPVK